MAEPHIVNGRIQRCAFCKRVRTLDEDPEVLRIHVCPECRRKQRERALSQRYGSASPRRGPATSSSARPSTPRAPRPRNSPSMSPFSPPRAPSSQSTGTTSEASQADFDAQAAKLIAMCNEAMANARVSSDPAIRRRYTRAKQDKALSEQYLAKKADLANRREGRIDLAQFNSTERAAMEKSASALEHFNQNRVRQPSNAAVDRDGGRGDQINFLNGS